MQNTVDIVKTKRRLQEHLGKCVDGKYVLDNANAVVAFPYVHPDLRAYHGEYAKHAWPSQTRFPSYPALTMLGTEKGKDCCVWDCGKLDSKTIKLIKTRLFFVKNILCSNFQRIICKAFCLYVFPINKKFLFVNSFLWICIK